MKLTLHIWRQPSRTAAGKLVTYQLDGVSPDMSFLEMLDTLNEKLVKQGEDAVAFDHDCREGICGSCSLMINGQAHGPERVLFATDSPWTDQSAELAAIRALPFTEAEIEAITGGNAVRLLGSWAAGPRGRETAVR